MNVTFFALYLAAAPKSASNNALNAVGLDNCFGVNVSKGILDPIIQNVINFFKYFAPGFALVCLLIGVVASLANKGGPWFVRTFVILFVVAGIGTIGLQFVSIGGASVC